MPRPARRYSKRIQVWGSTPTHDGFSGRTLTDALVKTIWAEVRTLDPEKSTLNGIERGVLGVEVFCRKDPGIDWANETLFLVISGARYRILGIEDLDLNGIEVRILATI